MREGKTFDEMPHNPDTNVFITDFSTVHVQNWVEAELYSGFAKSGMRWMEIEFPEVPDKKPKAHLCTLGSLECWESFTGNLFVRIKGEPCTSFEQCNFCPICGFR